jgi:hypothetical protein
MSTSQVASIAGVSHHVQLRLVFLLGLVDNCQVSFQLKEVFEPMKK